ncbi:polyprenyl synthetase family protein [Leifsonia sp. ZF2019]|uniref:polyprenyl synthetase family protein n=1 Tax=Leifsonia sp. ZF2019 TaxID=2781978 RepID=UPI001CBE89C5|nr:polyprenyl synthetase family protein [Leifsonia sp. ZF2019]UAJ78124.1 polyprenyl synthetase family protein [Leifsonia sp. ZF2019]
MTTFDTGVGRPVAVSTPLDIASGLERVDGRLASFFAERTSASAGLGDDYQRLWSSARAAADGGKRMRPRLVLATLTALGRPVDETAIDTAVAFELLHTAFLLHDDVIDGDTVRRGRPNLSGEFAAQAAANGVDRPRSALWGEAASILAGDLLLHAATALVGRVDVPTEARLRLLDVLDHSVVVTAAGELTDVSLAVGLTSPTLPAVLGMTERKTAAYSVAGPTMAGAILAGGDDRLLAALAEYGRLVGVAFQLGDDLLGVYGDQERTGKSVLSDLREGKKTTLIAFARSTESWPTIEARLGRGDLTLADAAELAAALEDCGARRFVERLLIDQVDRAIAVLDAPAVPPPLAEELAGIARGCVGRIA